MTSPMLTCGFSLGTGSSNRTSSLVANSRAGKGKLPMVGFQKLTGLRQARSGDRADLGRSSAATLSDDPHQRLLRGLIEDSGHVGHQGGTVLFVGQPTHEYHQDERPRSIHDGRIMMNLCDFAGLMSNASARRYSGRNALIELLAFQHFYHLARGIRIDSLAIRDGSQQNLQTPRRGCVIKAFFKRLVVLHAAKNVHPLCAESVN